MPGRKLMTTEDCEPVVQVLAVSLAESFEPIRRAGTLAAVRALWHADPETFDLVIGGLDLTGGTGDDRRRRFSTRTPRRIPFLLIAGSPPGVRGSRTDFMILSKPFCMKDLIQAIETLVPWRHLSQI